MAKKSGLSDRMEINIPISDTDDSILADVSGNGYNARLYDGAKVVTDGSRYAVDLSGGVDGVIPYDLPFGESFTLCFWMKSNQSVLKWMLNGYNGRQYIEKAISITPNTWFHLAFRFNGSSVAVFKDGSFVHNGSVGEAAVGFALYDDEVFGSSVLYDDIRLLDYALPDDDIVSVINGKADELIQTWSTPIRVNPYDGQDGKPGTSVTIADVEYAQSSSNTTTPTTGWSTTAPNWVDGQYIWSRTKITYSDGSTSFTKAACITGGKGNDGKPGNDGVGIESIVEQYYLSSSATSLLNGSWSTNRPDWKDKWYIWTRSVITYTNGTSTTTAAICVTGSKGDKGEPGSQGEKGESPAAVFVGIYSSSKTYIGNKFRVDVVKYNGVFYVARIDAGSFVGIVPTNTSKWNPFGAQFESVATNLLLAENANIGGMIFCNNRLESQKKDANGNPIIIIDGAKGDGVFSGIIKGELVYSGTRVVTSSKVRDYTINPVSEPARTYFINEPDSIRTIWLPDANLYDGLEIQIFTKNSRSSMWNPTETHTHVGCAKSGQILYFKLNMYLIPLLYISGNQLKYEIDPNKHKIVEDFSVPYKECDAPDTMLMLPNIIYEFKAMNGAWYSLQGLYTGE